MPPKIIDDPSEPVTDPGNSHFRANSGSQENLVGDESNDSSSGVSSLSVNRSTFPRRSSVVVIPPMQVCPGDLLVYSKALTHRGNISGTKKTPTNTLFRAI